jgi:hypothetical protein
MNTSSSWSIYADVQNERTPNGAAVLQSKIDGSLGKGLAEYTTSSERAFRRVIYLSQLYQSVCLKVTVDGGRLGAAAAAGPQKPNQPNKRAFASSHVAGTASTPPRAPKGDSGMFDRPWGCDRLSVS